MRRREFITLLGAAAATMTAVRKVWAQSAGRTYRLGVLVQGPRNAAHWIVFFDELRKQGFLEGVNLSVVDAFNTPLDRAAKTATVMIKAQPHPILTVSDDLLAEKAVTSLSHPGGNTTGISILATELDGKRQEILLETIPDVRRLAVLADAGVTTPEQLKALEDAAKAHDVTVSTHIALHADNVIPAIDAALSAGAQAINVLASALFFVYRAQIIERMAAARLPAIYQWPEMAEERGLMAYGPRFVAGYCPHAI